MAAISNPDRTTDLSPYPWPRFEEDEMAAVAEVLRTGKVNYWTGTVGRDFEKRFAEYFGVRHAIAMANGTVTLQACLRVLGIGPGDEVVTTPRTFIGTTSAIVMEGATPVFADVDRDSGNITAETIASVITPRTKAIIPVHLAGWPCDMEAIMALAEERGLKVIEDCAQSHGARIRGQHTGTFGHISSWSYCQDKIMTTGGEGGMIGTDDEELWARAWAVKDHGKSYDTVYNQPHPPGFRWLHESWGTNWRLTEMQSAIGLCQLRKLPEWTAARTRNAQILERALRPLSTLRVPLVPDHMDHAYYKLYAYLRAEALKSGWSRDRVLAEFAARGVPGLSGSCSEIYLERAFTDHGMALPERLPVARELGETSVMFLVHPTIPARAMEEVAGVVTDVIRAATR
jgi:dTDP-4-amino-4,6-dideoxygalactose transaminase